MKRQWKIFWVLCISLAALGIALCIAGALLGATQAGIREVFGIGSRREYARAAAYEDQEDYTDSEHSGTEYESTEWAETEALEESLYYEGTEDSTEAFLEADGVRKLKIDATHLEIILRTGGGDRIRVSSEVDPAIKEDFSVRQDEDELKIELKNKGKWEKTHFSSWEDIEGAVVIDIPSGMQFQEVSMKIGAGTLDAENIQTKELELECGAGTVSIAYFKAEEFELECGAGEVEIHGEATKETKMECGVGTVTYYTAGSQEDYDYDLQCGIGTLEIGDSSYVGLGSGRKINNGAGKKMEIECGIGIVEVMFEE